MTIKWFHNQSETDWIQLSELYRLAPLGEKNPIDLKEIFSNSRFKCFIYDDSHLIGAGRALADGKDCSYICDIAVHPDYQNTGLGKQIVKTLVDDSAGYKKIILYSNPGIEGFYEKMGFKQMKTAMAIFADQEQAIKSGLIVTD